MTDRELASLKEQREALNERQKHDRDHARELRSQAQTLEERRAQDKATVAELDVQIQSEERTRAAAAALALAAAGQSKRQPHPSKPDVLIETVEVEKPVTFGRALKKVFLGR